MAYNSDTQIKNVLKKIHTKAQLKNLRPRFFAESRDDQKLWEHGGLTFEQYGIEYGSNDFGWFEKKEVTINGKKCNFKPVIIVEGTYGLRHRNTGSAQFARFSHALGACHNGACGILFQDFVWKGDNPARTQPDLVYAAIRSGMQLNQPYLVVDVNDEDLMIKILKAYDVDDKDLIDSAIEEAHSKMNKHLNDYAPMMSKKFLALKDHEIVKVDFLNLINNNLIYDGLIKTLLFDFESFTQSHKRNGHTILGEVLVYAHIVAPKKMYLLMPRMFKKDIDKLKKTYGKEQTLIFNHPAIKIIGFENLICSDEFLQENILEMRGKTFKGESEMQQKKLDKSIYSTQKKNAFKKTLDERLINGSIKINI